MKVIQKMLLSHFEALRVRTETLPDFAGMILVTTLQNGSVIKERITRLEWQSIKQSLKTFDDWSYCMATNEWTRLDPREVFHRSNLKRGMGTCPTNNIRNWIKVASPKSKLFTLTMLVGLSGK